MERVRVTILDNIRNVSWLELYPTHQLRALNQSSCVPEILHEARHIPSLTRMLSGDSRRTILAAIEQTLVLIMEGLPVTVSFIETVRTHQTKFVRGVSTLQTHYENDMYVTMVIGRILSVWSQIIHTLSMRSLSHKEESTTDCMSLIVSDHRRDSVQIKCSPR